MEQAVAYFRTSSAANVGEDKDSLKRQQEAVTGYAKANGFEIGAEFYDAGISGSDDLINREGFSALLDRIEGNGVRTVIIESADRLARKTLTQEVGIIALQERGVRCLTASGMDLTDDSDEFKVAMRQVAAVFSQLERARLVKKLRGARDRKSKEIGHRIEGRKGYAVTHPEMVKEAKRLRRKSPKTGKTRSLRTIAAELVVLGHTRKDGRAFNPQSVKNMIAG